MPSTLSLPLTASQQLLLKAACCLDESGMQAWQQWHETVDIEQLDSDSYRLLPLLYKNLSVNQVQTSEMNRLQGVYRRHWYSNQLMIRELTNVLQAFEAAGIYCSVVGDVAWLSYYGSDLGMRPIDQLDIVVSPQDAQKAIQLLATLNWNAKVKLTDSFMSLHAKIGLWNSSQQLLHLHWRLFGMDVFSNSDDHLWQTDLVSLNHQTIRTLNSIAQILYLCTCITTPNGAIAPLGVADFIKIVSSHSSENFWQLLIQTTLRARLTLSLQHLIKAGHTILDLPSSVVERIQTLPISQLEQLEQQWGEPSGRSPVSRYLQHLRQADVSQGESNPSVRSLIHYYQQSWGLKQGWQVPFYGIYRLASRWVDSIRIRTKT